MKFYNIEPVGESEENCIYEDQSFAQPEHIYGFWITCQNRYFEAHKSESIGN